MFLFFTGLALSAQGREWSFVENDIKFNPYVLEQQSYIEGRKWDLLAAKQGLFLPSFKFDISSQFNKRKENIFGKTFNDSRQFRELETWTFELSYTVFNGGLDYYEFQDAKAGLKRAKLSYKQQKREVLYSSLRSILSYSRLKEDLYLYDALYKTSRKRHELSVKRLKQGLLDVSSFKRSELSLLNAKADLESQRLTMAQTILEFDQALIPRNETKKMPPLTFNEVFSWAQNIMKNAQERGQIVWSNEQKRKALANNPSLKQLGLQADQEIYRLKKIRSRFMPKLEVFAKYQRQGTPFKDHDDNETRIGLRASWDILRSGRDYANYQEQTNTMTATKHRTHASIYQQSQKARILALQAFNQWALVQQQEKQAKLAREIYLKSEKRYLQGAINIIQPLEDQRDWYQNMKSKQQTLYSLAKTLLELKFLTGDEMSIKTQKVLK